MKLSFGKWDFLAIAAVLLVAVGVFALFLPKNAQPGSRVEIYQHGRLIQTLRLDTDREFTVDGSYRNTVTVRDGRVAVTHSTCPGGDCVSCGWLDGPGKSIVCLPNGLEIRVIAHSDVDIIVG